MPSSERLPGKFRGVGPARMADWCDGITRASREPHGRPLRAPGRACAATGATGDERHGADPRHGPVKARRGRGTGRAMLTATAQIAGAGRPVTVAARRVRRDDKPADFVREFLDEVAGAGI